MSTVRISDAELVSKYVQGHEPALERLVLRHADALLHKIYLKVQDPDLTQDIHQETWIKFVRAVKAGEYTEKGSFPAFIHRVATNLAYDHLRKQKRSPELSMERCGDAVMGVEDGHMNRKRRLCEANGTLTCNAPSITFRRTNGRSFSCAFMRG